MSFFSHLQLSLRDNPLVVRFVRDMTLEPPSLLELAGRTVKLHGIPIRMGDIPTTLMNYLKAAQCCVNPKCRGNSFLILCRNIVTLCSFSVIAITL